MYKHLLVTTALVLLLRHYAKWEIKNGESVSNWDPFKLSYSLMANLCKPNVLNVKAPIGSFDGEKAILELLSDYCGNFEKFRCNLLW